MKFCFANRNITIGFVEVKTSNFLVISRKKMTGLIGDILHRDFELDNKKK